MFSKDIFKQDINAYVNGFSFMTAEQLSGFLKAHELSFSLEEITYIREYFKNKKCCFPTYNQLAFFDELNRIHKAQKNDYAIYKVTANEGADDIIESSKDLLSKRSVIKKKSFGAMPVAFAADISREYLNYIGVSNDNSCFCPAESIPNSDFCIHTNNDVPLFSYCEPNKKNTPTPNGNLNNAFAVLCPLVDMSYDEYLSRANEFLSLPEISSSISEHTILTDAYGLFGALIKETNGIFVDLSNVPEIPKNEYGKVIELTSLCSSCIGRHVFTINTVSIGIVNQIAMQRALCACIFATRNYSKVFTLESTRNPAFSFDFDFLKKIISFKEHRIYLFSKESGVSIGEKAPVFLTSYKEAVKQTYRADRVLNFGKFMASATSRDLSRAPHKTAAIAVIDAVNSLIAKGVAKSSISVAAHYSLLGGTEDSAELGKNLAAILGVYRSAIELALSQIKPQISYSNSKRTITVLASAKTPKRPIGSSFKNGETNVYFMPIYFSESGLPDYEKYRALVACFYRFIENDFVISSFAINENLLQTVKSAAKFTLFEFFEGFKNESAHGILFESYEKLECGEKVLLVGKTRKKESE